MKIAPYLSIERFARDLPGWSNYSAGALDPAWNPPWNFTNPEQLAGARAVRPRSSG
jgi:hypothetical protein